KPLGHVGLREVREEMAGHAALLTGQILDPLDVGPEPLDEAGPEVNYATGAGLGRPHVEADAPRVEVDLSKLQREDFLRPPREVIGERGRDLEVIREPRLDRRVLRGLQEAGPRV